MGGRLENARRQGRHLENPINQVRVGDGGGCAAVVTEGGRGTGWRGAKGASYDSKREREREQLGKGRRTTNPRSTGTTRACP